MIEIYVSLNSKKNSKIPVIVLFIFAFASRHYRINCKKDVSVQLDIHCLDKFAKNHPVHVTRMV